MFNQFCSVIERHYAVPVVLRHLVSAVPVVLDVSAIDSVYEGLSIGTLLTDFEMLYPTLAFDSKRECFVIADLVEGQRGLYGARAVLHCQSIDLSSEELPDEVKEHAPVLPRDAVVVTITKVYAVGKTRLGRVNFSGDVGITFTASKRSGMICDPGAMKLLENQRLEQANPEDRWAIFNFGREETVKAAVRAVEYAIYVSERPEGLHKPEKARPKRTKRKLPLWEERVWVGA